MAKKKKKLIPKLKTKHLIAILFVLAFAAIGGYRLIRNSLASYQQMVTNTYTNLAWPFKAEGYSTLGWTLAPMSDPSPQGFFWANQFGIKNSTPNSGGYAGLQTSTLSRSNKIAIFSIWNAVGATSPGAAETFGNEGSGYKTTINYDWQVGKEYRFKIENPGNAANGNRRWKATIKDLTTGVTSEIGTIEVPSTWGNLNDQVVSFTEYFYGNISSCSTIPYVAAKFTNFAMDGVLATYQNNYYESGQACASASKVTNVTLGALHEIGSITNQPPPSSATDTTAPVVSIYQPLSGSNLKTGPISITGASTDNDRVVSMQVYIDNVLFASSASGSIQTTWNATAPKGKKSGKTYTIKVVAKDPAGNTGQKSYSVTITQ